MKQLVQYTIRQYDMIPAGTRVLCGLSGGADSVSLLLCLHELGYDVCACHLNHGLRGAQADADEAFCRDLCRRLAIPFVSQCCDANEAAKRTRQSVETAARELRYKFFAESAEKCGADRIATAHTADDNLETMLFHLIRGTGAAGLAGIPPVRGNIIRPLILTERKQLIAYLDAHDQPWCTDATNLDDSCTRNRIRHHVIPALRDIEPQAARHAAQAAALLRQDDACLDAMAQVTDGRIEAETLAQMPDAIASRAVRNLLTHAGVPMGEIGNKHITAVMHLAKKSKGSVSLPGKTCAVLERGALTVRKKEDRTAAVGLPAERTVPFGKYTVCLTRKADIHSSFNYYPLAYDTINTVCLHVRTWQASDRMTLPGMRGARSLKRLYAEHGILPQVRDTLPVLCCKDTVIAAAGLGVDAAFCGTSGVFAVGLQQSHEEEKEI